MEIRQIRVFLAVVKAGSFAGASKSLNMTQAGLGYQVRQLEMDLQADLLTRHSRGVALTPAGEAFLRHAEALMTSLDTARVDVAGVAKTMRPTLKIGLSPTAVQLLSPALTAASIAPNAAINIQLKHGVSRMLCRDLERDELDVAFCLWQDDLGARCTPLYRERLYLFGPRSDSEQETISFNELAGVRLIGGPQGHGLRDSLEAAAAAFNFKLDFVQDIEPGSLCRSLLLHSDQRMIAPFSLFLDDVTAHLLSGKMLVEPELWCEVHLMWRRRPSEDVENALIEIARASVQDHHQDIEWIGAPH